MSTVYDPAKSPSLSKNEKPHLPSPVFSGSLYVYVSVSSVCPSYDSTLSITFSRVTSPLLESLSDSSSESSYFHLIFYRHTDQ